MSCLLCGATSCSCSATWTTCQIPDIGKVNTPVHTTRGTSEAHLFSIASCYTSSTTSSGILGIESHATIFSDVLRQHIAFCQMQAPVSSSVVCLQAWRSSASSRTFVLLNDQDWHCLHPFHAVSEGFHPYAHPVHAVSEGFHLHAHILCMPVCCPNMYQQQS